MTSQEKKQVGFARRLVRWTVRLVLFILLILAAIFLFVFRTALYHRVWTFPKEAAAWDAIRAQRQPVALDDGWDEFRGACHAHSELSHDSEVTFPEILAACKEADLDFIFMSDHCINGKGDYSLGWEGDHDGVIFVRGFEMSGGFMPWGLPDTLVLDCGADSRQLAREIAANGGLLFFAHSEEERLWDLPELVGMEIYNIHADFKGEGIPKMAPDIILSLRSYPDQMMRLIFDAPTSVLAKWDDLNRTRKIVGIAANDAHQNTGFRGYYTDNNTFLLRTTGPDDIGEWKLNWFTRGLVRVAFGPLEPGKQLFCIALDRYARSLRYVNTHMLAREKSAEGLLEALRSGRVFVAFDMLADASGFTYLAQAKARQAVMGETIALEPGLTLKAESPVPCRFTLFRDGEKVGGEQIGRTFVYLLNDAGRYRIEADLHILGQWTPWVYSNPIRVTGPLPDTSVPTEIESSVAAAQPGSPDSPKTHMTGV